MSEIHLLRTRPAALLGDLWDRDQQERLPLQKMPLNYLEQCSLVKMRVSWLYAIVFSMASTKQLEKKYVNALLDSKARYFSSGKTMFHSDLAALAKMCSLGCSSLWSHLLQIQCLSSPSTPMYLMLHFLNNVRVWLERGISCTCHPGLCVPVIEHWLLHNLQPSDANTDISSFLTLQALLDLCS